ncbi:cysteine desulfurase [Gemmatimonadota bacterium]
MKKGTDNQMSVSTPKNVCPVSAGQEIRPLDVDRVREDFPILTRRVRGKPLVYLDSAATSQKPKQVIDKVTEYYREYNANPHRGIHTLSEEATAAYEGARAKLAGFLNAPDPSSVVFTKNCTEAINLVAYSWARQNLKPGDEIVATVMEHHSNIVPWQMAATDCGAVLRYLPVKEDGMLDGEKIQELIGKRTRLVCVTGMSNVLGTVVNLEPIVNAAHSAGALVLVDAAQLVPHLPVDFQALDVDFLAVAGHKMLGPTGVGALVARKGLLEEMSPFIAGGGTILDVSLEGTKWIEPPWKFEGGTPMIAQAIGLGAAVDYLEALGMEAVYEHEKTLVRHALEVFRNIDGLILYGLQDTNARGATFSFNVGDGRGGIIHPHDLGTFFDQEGIAVRAGHHCAKPLMSHFSVVSMCRASCYLYNTPDEIDTLAEAIEKAKKFFLGA